MILARFFRPKWQHSNPQVRRQALVRLAPQEPEAQAILRRLAEQDVDAEVRKTAVKRLDDFAFLRARVLQDQNAGVREVAAARYRQLLAGGVEAVDLSVRLAELGACPDDDALLSYIARRAREPELRLAALQRLQAEAVLEEIALHDSVPKVRQAAAQRLTEPASLERVMRHSREQDRRVARIARDALEQLQREQAAAAEARAERLVICQSLEALAAADRMDIPERQRLQNRWKAVAVAADRDLQTRFEAALAACQARAAEPEPVLVPEPQPAVVDASRLQELLSALRADAQPTPERLAQMQAELALWAGMAEGVEPQLALLGDYQAAAQRYLEQEEALKRSLAAVSKLDRTPEQECRRLSRQLQQILEAVRWPLDLSPPALLQNAQAALVEIDKRLEQLGEQQVQLRNEVEQVLAALQAELEAGRLRESLRLQAQAQRLVEQLAAAERRRFDRRLREHAAQVRELQDWRRFATLPKQEQLCEQMEALIDADMPVPELAERIHRLQEQWKATGGSNSPEGQQLWERFRSAGDQAFARCRGYFDEQAQRRKQNLQQRQQLAQQLEEFVATAEWPQLELSGLEAIRAQARAEWLAAAPVDRRAGKAVEAKFEALMEALTEQIRAKQESNRRRKEAIVEQARQLTTADDAWAAAEQAKVLQGEWQAAGRAQPNLDRRLWREFRKACDEIFARRDMARGQAEQEQGARLQAAQQLCEQAEALLAGTGLAAAELEDRLAALRAEFDALQPLPRPQVAALGQRLRAVERKAAERRRHQRQAQEQEALAAARARAELCDDLEQLVLTAAEVKAEQWQQRWQALAEAPAELQAKLERRWQRALAAAAGESGFAANELAANLEERWDLCLWMEILAGVEVPAEEQNRRMNVQVRRLADGLGAGGQQPQAVQVRAVEAEWLVAGPMPVTAQAQALTSRFAAARAAADRHP